MATKATKVTAKTGGKARKVRKASGILSKMRVQLLALSDPKPPPIPTDRLVGEGRALAKVSAKHEKELRRVGLDAKSLRSLDDRASALAEAQSALTLVRRTKRTKKEIELESAGIMLRSEVVADGRFALRDDPDAQAMLDHIQEGEGLDDLVQDLRDLATFAREHKGLLAKVGAKPAVKIKQATSLATALEQTVAKRRAGDAEEHGAIDLRDRAATYLLALMREVRVAGAYAFRDKPEVAVRFRGVYDARRRARARGKKVGPGAVPDAGGDHHVAG